MSGKPVEEHKLEVNTDATGFVIRGYDPVAYFTEGRPVPGRSDLSVEHEGGKYLFATAANRDAFKANPEKFAPRYGGYCAYGVAVGKKFDIDPSSWRIVDGKLYFNLNPVILPTPFRERLEGLETYIKLAVDVERTTPARGGEYHADGEEVLLEDGSLQEDIWGADWYPEHRKVGERPNLIPPHL
jgi:YHS domain-containing protein